MLILYWQWNSGPRQEVNPKEDMKLDLDAAQAAMRSKMERLAEQPASRTKPSKPLTPARAVRIFIAQELRRAYGIRRRKRRERLRYLQLKRDKRKVTKALLTEMRTMLRTFAELNAAMAESRDALRGALRTYDRKSKQFQMGYELGKEQTAITMKETTCQT